MCGRQGTDAFLLEDVPPAVQNSASLVSVPTMLLKVHVAPDSVHMVESVGLEITPKNSISLSRWEQKLRDFEMKQAHKSSRVPLPPVHSPCPSPVASRTRTSLKRASSFSCDEETQPRMSQANGDRTSISLRKALGSRKSREVPQSKRGKRDESE
jgi:hypothetical protein